MIEHLKKLAVGRVAHLPQYKGHYDGWVLGKATKRIKTRTALIAEKGGYVILDPNSVSVIPWGPKAGQESVRVWSPTALIDTTVPVKSLTW